MTREEYNDFANALKNNYTIDFDKLPEFCDMAISVLSTEGEYIKKADILNELGDTNMDILTDEVKEIVNGLQTYSFPDSAENKEKITALEAENKTLQIKLENAEDVLRGLKEDLADARAELRERW